jgi:glucose-6-phosphate isomerase
MLGKNNPAKTKSWKKLGHHFEDMKAVHMKSLFAKDPERFKKFSIRFSDILVDYSKNILTEKTVQLLTELAREVKLKDAIKSMFTGEKINRACSRERR